MSQAKELIVAWLPSEPRSASPKVGSSPPTLAHPQIPAGEEKERQP